MFDLEQAITEWRKQMLTAGIKTPVPLEELEIHLREEVEERMRSGLSAKIAFETAAQNLGPAKALQSEFNHVNKTTKRNLMKRIIIITVGILALLLGPALILPALAFYRHHGAMGGMNLFCLLLGIGLTLGGGGIFFSLKKRRA